MVLALVDDLLFSSRIRAAAERTGRPISFVRSRAALLPEIAKTRPDLVIIDLDRESLDPIGAIRDVKSLADGHAVPMVGFVSHVHADLIDAARRAGCDQVLARSAFVNRLPDLFAKARPDSPEPSRS